MVNEADILKASNIRNPNDKVGQNWMFMDTRTIFKLKLKIENSGSKHRLKELSILQKNLIIKHYAICIRIFGISLW